MPTADIYGFEHGDIDVARRAIETALSVHLEEHQEGDYPGCWYRVQVLSGACVQVRLNSGPFLRWRGDPAHPWYPAYPLLVFLHGTSQEIVAEHLRHVPGLSFLETRKTTC